MNKYFNLCPFLFDWVWCWNSCVNLFFSFPPIGIQSSSCKLLMLQPCRFDLSGIIVMLRFLLHYYIFFYQNFIRFFWATRTVLFTWQNHNAWLEFYLIIWDLFNCLNFAFISLFDRQFGRDYDTQVFWILKSTQIKFLRHF